jgi:hypothetical protein
MVLVNNCLAMGRIRIRKVRTRTVSEDPGFVKKKKLQIRNTVYHLSFPACSGLRSVLECALILYTVCLI